MKIEWPPSDMRLYVAIRRRVASATDYAIRCCPERLLAHRTDLPSTARQPPPPHTHTHNIIMPTSLLHAPTTRMPTSSSTYCHQIITLRPISSVNCWSRDMAANEWRTVADGVGGAHTGVAGFEMKSVWCESGMPPVWGYLESNTVVSLYDI